MRSRPGISLVLILILSLAAGWLALPSDWFDIAGIKRDVNINEGLDLQGGVQLLLEADPPPGVNVDSDTMQGVRDTIERRVNGLGV
ncbi:MAG: protein translocase subunit SecD, partial [Chloroflexota bacterium]|nr:protein translocase subunit SecD [Chloroflexota bacterium]